VSYHKRNRHAPRAMAESSFDEFELALRRQKPGRRDNGQRDHKAMQLCRQVERAIALALAGECHDDVLRDLTVETVEPASGTAQLVVRLRVPPALDLADVLQRLDHHAPRLRFIVAGAICRKRAPALTFICLPATLTEGGGNA
jgi:ribosome-binding factor A